MTRRHTLAILSAILLASALVTPAAVRAASDHELSLDEMVEMAEDIVVGRVARSEARWQGKLIVTVSTIEVNESLKGRQRTAIEITQLGGTAVHPVMGAAVTMTVSEETTLRPGEEVVLFVRQTKPGTRQLVGGAQGKLVVRADAATGAASLPVAPKQLRVEREGNRNAVAADVMTLDGLRERVRAALTHPRRPPGGAGRGAVQ